MGLLVIGLSSNGDIRALHQRLAQAGLPTEPLQAIEPSDTPSALTHGFADSGLLEPNGGTGVPGINNSSPAAALRDDDSMSTRLSDLEIPDSAIANYEEALERGRFVIAYPAHAADADLVERAFEAAGMANVRRY